MGGHDDIVVAALCLCCCFWLLLTLSDHYLLSLSLSNFECHFLDLHLLEVSLVPLSHQLASLLDLLDLKGRQACCQLPLYVGEFVG